jgi:Ca2+:H+ antiporter
MMPSVFHSVADNRPGGWTPQAEQELSLAIAIVLFVTYLFTLWFSLKTHKQLFIGNPSQGVAAAEDEETHAPWSRGKSIGILLGATVFVAIIAEFLVGAIENAAPAMGLTHIFVGVIVVAIIGNAAEHSSAIMMALKNKMDLSIGIAIGSSLQVALFVAPILVFASYAFGQPMNLEFTIPEVVAVVVAIGIVGQVSGDGESNWLEGVQLLSVYAILAILFYFLPEMAAASATSRGAH